MAIAYRSQASLPNASRTTTTVNMPAGVQANDVVLVFCATGNSVEVAITPPASLSSNPVVNLTYSEPVPPWSVNMRVYRYTVVGSGDPASFAFTHASASSEALAIAFSGVNTTTPIDATPTTNTSTGTNATVLGVTTTVAAVWLIAWRGSWDGNAITPPAGWTERLDQPVTWVAHREWATAGATGNFSIPSGNSGGASPWGTMLIPLRPAGGATQHAATGTVAVTSAASGSPVARLVAAGTIAVLTAANGAPAALHPATGAVPVTTTAAGSPTARHPASGTVPVVTTTAGTAGVLPGSGSLAATGVIPVVTSTSGTASQRHAATGAATVTTSASGAPTARHTAAGACGVVSTAAGSPSARYVANGTVIVVTSAVGTAFVFDPSIPQPLEHIGTHREHSHLGTIGAGHLGTHRETAT